MGKSIHSVQLHNKAIALKIVLVLAFVISVTIYALARSGGMTGRTSATSQGCSCHTTSQNSATTVAVTSSSGSFSVETGSTTTFTVTVSNSSASRAGVDIAVKTTQTGETDAGSLSPESGSGLQLSSGELSHSSPKNMQSGSASFSFTWTAPSNTGTYYLRAIGNAVNGNGSADNGDIWNWMAVQQITVTAAPALAVSAPAGGTSLCQGSQQNITWTSSGINNIKIELSSDGGSSYPVTIVNNTPAAAGSYSWNISSGQATGSTYRIRISDASNSSRTSESGVFSILGSTTITGHPQNLKTCTGLQASFSVTATGSNLTYQWKKNNTNIPNSNTANLTINSVTMNDAGNYTCVVTSPCGSPATSNAAVLTVDLSPGITRHPEAREICAGGSASFTVTAEGTSITYQWRKNGTNIDGATGTTLNLNNVSVDDAGSYDVLVSGLCSQSKPSNAAALTVSTPPEITQEPKSANVCENSKVIVSVKAAGSGLTYKWRKDGIEIPNTNSPDFTINKMLRENEGSYDVTISGKCVPPVTSSSAMILLSAKPEITREPASQTITEGSPVDFTVTAQGSDLKYQWRKDGIALLGKTSADLHLTSAKESDKGSYDCIVTNQCGSDTSAEAVLKVNKAGAGPILTLSQNTIDYGLVLVRSDSDTLMSEFIKNTGNQSLNINNIIIEGTDSALFSLPEIKLPLILQPGESMALKVRFSPASAGFKNAKLRFESNSLTNPVLNLSGEGGEIVLALTESVLNFPVTQNNEASEKSVLLKNEGTVQTEINFIISGPQADLFSVKSPSSGFILPGKNAQQMVIEFRPVNSTLADAEITISGKAGNPLVLKLRGNSANSVSSDDPEFSGLINIYPNPSNSTTGISFINNKPVEYEIYIADLSGTTVKRFGKMFYQAGNNFVNWDGSADDGSKTSSGQYIFIIRNEKIIRTFPFVIEK